MSERLPRARSRSSSPHPNPASPPARPSTHPPTPHLAQELLDKCNPLGMFDSIATLAVAQNMRDLYRLVLVDTPLAPYFWGGWVGSAWVGDG